MPISKTLNRPLISVVVPHLNQADALAACLSSLQEQALDYSLYEIIVVDNGSTHPPHEIVASCPNARLVIEAQPGPGPARNAGIREAQADYVAFLDADCRAHPAWLSTALHVLATSPKKTILGGDVQIWHPIPGQFTDVEAYESVFAYRSKLYVERHGFCPTGNLAAPRSAFKTIGMFRGIQFAEDMEWGDRARRAGFQLCYVAGMIVFHPARSSIHALYAKWNRQSQHYFNMIKGRPAWRLRWILRAVMVAVSPARDFVKVLTSDRVQGSAARAGAIIVLIKVRLHRACTMISLLRSNGPIRWNREPVQQADPPMA
jgi:glycosyltransferase involved in cell wall biosynthesis